MRRWSEGRVYATRLRGRQGRDPRAARHQQTHDRRHDLVAFTLIFADPPFVTDVRRSPVSVSARGVCAVEQGSGTAIKRETRGERPPRTGSRPTRAGACARGTAPEDAAWGPLFMERAVRDNVVCWMMLLVVSADSGQKAARRQPPHKRTRRASEPARYLSIICQPSLLRARVAVTDLSTNP